MFKCEDCGWILDSIKEGYAYCRKCGNIYEVSKKFWGKLDLEKLKTIIELK